MFDRLLRSLLAPAPAHLPDPDAHLALAALMVRVARSDDDYSRTEQVRIDRVLAATYDLSPEGAAVLRAQAEQLEAQAPDTVRFTRALKAAVPTEKRARLMESLWQVALADGMRDDDEEALLRLVANLLGLTDVESALARHRAERA